MGKIKHPGTNERVGLREYSGRTAAFICDASAEEQRKIDREFEESEFEVKKRIFGIKYPWQDTAPYSGYPYSHPKRLDFIDSEITKSESVCATTSSAAGVEKTRGHRHPTANKLYRNQWTAGSHSYARDR